MTGVVSASRKKSEAAGVASASRKKSESGELLDVKNGRLEMSVQDDSGDFAPQSDFNKVNEIRLKKVANKALKSDGPINIKGEDAAGFMAKGVEKLNEAADAGKIEFGRQNGEVVVTPTAQSIKEVPGSPTKSGLWTAGSHSNRRVSSQVHDSDCGESKWIREHPDPGDISEKSEEWIYLSDDDTQQMVSELNYTSTASALAAVLFDKTGAGVPLTILAAIITFATGSLSNVLSDNNEGCGVVIYTSHDPFGPSVISFSIDIYPQHS